MKSEPSKRYLNGQDPSMEFYGNSFKVKELPILVEVTFQTTKFVIEYMVSC